MKHVVVGTAGHIDHGKTSLVKALTGTDTDRLPEEKARGITIDLGFAFLEEPDGLTIEIVDVPGHERFIKNMLAGIGGIDVAMLVIAADEGVMPQTREHFGDLLAPARSPGAGRAHQDRPRRAGLAGAGPRGRRRARARYLPGRRPDRRRLGQDRGGDRRAARHAARAGSHGAGAGHGPAAAAADRPRVHDQGLRHRHHRHPDGGAAARRRSGRGVPGRRAGEGARVCRLTAMPSPSRAPASVRP